MDKQKPDVVSAFDAAIAAALRGKLAEKNLTRIFIAERTGIPVTTLNRYFKGERAVSVSKLVAISGAMGVEAGEIIKAAEHILDSAKQENGI